MAKKMLIDAAHPEETRVVALDGGRVDEFDFESAAKKQLRGNIYLARVTRVEPSLQAAFVEYGGNRHGFLAFNEIHPDYYQIPFEDRQALLEEERAAVRAAAVAAGEVDGDADAPETSGEATEADGADDNEDDADEASQEASQRRGRLARRYKIQEVIKRRQILLVQVVKEERGSKGAALTTYLSLAGRYCVLMPNTARGGGISRKITSAADRKRLRKIVEEFEVPDGMGLIVRTAGAKRTKTEVRRDYDYLLKLWETIRETTLNSTAPSLIHEEDSLVKRAIRDLYDKDVEAVLVEGDAAYRQAKDFIRMLMPSHAKKVQPYKADQPLFLREQVEDQLDAVYDPVVPLRSGGYLVINQTEALVAIDVNSGRSTRERNIEATALKTNLEAAEEACRQFRLRDLAGLIVIDFIDMEEAKNNRAVEKRMRDSLKRDRARVQAGKISGFGLMELSRQRRRASILEGSHQTCPTCKGRGIVRSVESSALHILRRIEEEGVKGAASRIRVTAPSEVALYLLNEKRAHLNAVEERYAMTTLIAADPDLIPPDCEIERLDTRRPEDSPAWRAAQEAPVQLVEIEDEDEDDVIAEEVDEDEVVQADAEEDAGRSKRRRRRRRRRPGAEANGEAAALIEADGEAGAEAEAESGEDAVTADASEDAETGEAGEKPKRRRRGRRGGRSRRNGASAANGEPEAMRVVDPEAEAVGEAADGDTPPALEAAQDAAVALLEADTPAEPAEPAAPEEPAEPEELVVAATDEPEPAEERAPERPEPVAAEELESEPEPEPAPQPAPEVEALQPAGADAAMDELPVAAEPAPPSAEDEARRRRWQDRLKTWLNG